MSLEAKKYATYDDLLALPDGQHAEIIAGIICMAPGPNAGHRHVTSQIDRSIGTFFSKNSRGDGSGNQNWIIELDPDVQFGADYLRPDLAGWKAARRGPIDPLETLVAVVPDWICEIVSPSTAKRDRFEKYKIYEKYAVPYYWLVDPINKTLEVFALQSGNSFQLAMVAAGADKVNAPPFTELELDLSTFWLG